MPSWRAWIHARPANQAVASPKIAPQAVSGSVARRG
jgi:hypothetical protein